MQCNSEKFQPGQIEFLTENREGIKATLYIRTIEVEVRKYTSSDISIASAEILTKVIPV